MKQKKQQTPGFTKSQMEKIVSDANYFRAKYPEIAKMTVQEVVETDLFATKLKNSGAFDIDNFRTNYLACINQQSKLPAAKRVIIVAIGNDAYKRTVHQMVNDYEQNKDIQHHPLP